VCFACILTANFHNKSSTNNHKFIIKEILTKSFDEFPIIFYDILSDELGGYIELLELNIRFNLCRLYIIPEE
jgi:hypothetical protein